MGISLNKSVVEPTCDCCDKLVMYVLNGCKSECGLSKCCTCKIEVVNHNADDFVVEENNNEKHNLLFKYYRHQEYIIQSVSSLHLVLYSNIL